MMSMPARPLSVSTILCPVDFSNLCEREIDVAVELCETFGARLVLHHNLDLAPPGYAKTWEWEWRGEHPPEDAEALATKRMDELLARLPASVRPEATLSRGLVVPVLLHLIEKLPADLVILGSHGWSTEEHASVSERLIERCPCPVFTIHEGEQEAEPFALRDRDVHVLVPSDFSASADQAVRWAFDLARLLPLRLHLLHVVSAAELAAHALPLDYVDQIRRPKGAVEMARQELAAMVPPDLEGRVEVAVETGPVVETMAAFAARLAPRLIVMGRHARGVLRHFFTRDTSREMLHRASCPVLFAA